MSAYDTNGEDGFVRCGAVQICLGLDRSSAMRQRAGGKSVQVYLGDHDGVTRVGVHRFFFSPS